MLYRGHLRAGTPLAVATWTPGKGVPPGPLGHGPHQDASSGAGMCHGLPSYHYKVHEGHLASAGDQATRLR